MFSVILGIYLGMELLGYMVTVFNFWGTAKPYHEAAVPFYIPNSNVLGFQFLCILHSTAIVYVFLFCRPSRCKVYLIAILICISLD